MSYIEEVRQQILDGKRTWSVDEYGSDYDAFFTQAVAPLRSLRAKGMIQAIEEISVAHDGETHIGIVEIIGAVNFDQENQKREK